MKYRTLLVALLFLVIFAGMALAGNVKKTGSAGAMELAIPVGARGVALGGATVANTSGVEALYWNPAGMAGTEGTQALFSYQPYLADIKVSYFGIASTIEGFGSLGVAAKVLSIGNIEQTTTDDPEGTGNIYNPTLLVVGVSYARIMTANVRFGVTANLVREDIFQAHATGLAFDAGVVYEPNWHGLAIGLVIKNYGPTMKFSGQGFELQNEAIGTRQVTPNAASFELPSCINIGMSYNLYQAGKSNLAVLGNFRSNNFQPDHWEGGAEYSFNDQFFLRGGYNYAKQDIDPQIDKGNDYIYGVALGAGVAVPVGGTKLTFDYSWRQTDVFEDNQFFTLKVGF